MSEMVWTPSHFELEVRGEVERKVDPPAAQAGRLRPQFYQGGQSAVVLNASAVFLLGVLALGASQALAQQAPASQSPPATPASPGSIAAPTKATAPLEEITVIAERLNLIGTATTASEGVIDAGELALTPAYRPGQLLETVPGLVVTVHSGEGKANQYLMRGYNLDHGTDLATFIDGIPVNEPSHAHGQGYTDLNFLIPELAGGLEYTKGTYYAAQGDFAGVGSVHIAYLNTIPDEVSVSGGSWDFERLFAAGSTTLAGGNLLGALELQHYDGPWVIPGDQRKINAVVRYSEGDAHDGYSLTTSFYHGVWNAQTDQPERAITQSLISRFGELDPSDQGAAQRANLAWQYFATIGGGQLSGNLYGFNNELTLFNNFTHFLVDPVNGDQEEQHENRWTAGGTLSYAHGAEVFGFLSALAFGLQSRYDDNAVSRLPSKNAQPLSAADDPLGYSESDQIHLASNAVYVQVMTHWNYWFRTVLGLREDYQHGTDSGTNHGTAGSALFEPKGSLIFTPVDTTEFYVSAGRGFHSNDLRGVNQGKLQGAPGAALIASETGEEIGVRQQLLGQRVALTLAVFNLDAKSQTTYNPDVGQDTAGPASRRTGYEINLTYQALRWLEFYASLSQDHARFKTPYDDGTGHLGEYLPNAPFATGSFNVYLKNLGPWSAGLEYRYLSAFPLSSGPCANSAVANDFPGLTSCANAPTPHGQVNGSGYGEWNGDAHYELAAGWNLALGVYNLLNKKADAMEYWYVDRLQGEPAYGTADLHVHPLEPISFRLTINKRF
jgi:outer membrane receptor protein involved in Fe transport